MSHDHAHGPPGPGDEARRGRDRRSLRAALGISIAFLALEIAGGLLTGSLALLADAGHMATDVAGLLLALFALRIAARAPTADKTFGWMRTEILAALANGVVLSGTALGIAIEAIRRFSDPPEVKAGAMLWIAIAGLLANLAAALVLHRASSSSLNVRAAFLHVLADALGSVGAIGAALAISLFGWRLADPVVAIAIAGLVLSSAWRLVRASVEVLMESAPAHVDVAALEREMRAIEGVVNVHDLHVWTLTSGYHAMSAHVDVADPAPSSALLDRLGRLARERFEIAHTTFQLEPAGPELASCSSGDDGCRVRAAG